MQYGGCTGIFPNKRNTERGSSTPNVFSPDWANGTDVLARFHMATCSYVNFPSESYIEQYRPIQRKYIFVMPPDDFNKVINSGNLSL
jgi:hypothetical protein